MKPYALIPLMLLAATAARGIIPPTQFQGLAARCAPQIAPDTLAALVRTESGFNPYAIGVVGGSVPQPRTATEALATIAKLREAGKNFSLGLAQVNRHNLAPMGLTDETALEPCANLRSGARILAQCYRSAPGETPGEKLRGALSCYYSGSHRSAAGLAYAKRVIGTPAVPSLEAARTPHRQRGDPAPGRAAPSPVPSPQPSAPAVPPAPPAPPPAKPVPGLIF